MWFRFLFCVCLSRSEVCVCNFVFVVRGEQGCKRVGNGSRSKHNHRSSLFYIHPSHTFYRPKEKKNKYTWLRKQQSPPQRSFLQKCGLDRSIITERERMDRERMDSKGKGDKDLNLKIVSVCTVANSLLSFPLCPLFFFFLSTLND